MRRNRAEFLICNHRRFDFRFLLQDNELYSLVASYSYEIESRAYISTLQAGIILIYITTQSESRSSANSIYALTVVLRVGKRNDPKMLFTRRWDLRRH